MSVKYSPTGFASYFNFPLSDLCTPLRSLGSRWLNSCGNPPQNHGDWQKRAEILKIQRATRDRAWHSRCLTLNDLVLILLHLRARRYRAKLFRNIARASISYRRFECPIISQLKRECARARRAERLIGAIAAA